MASERIIFGQDVSEPGRYRLCWLTSGETGEITHSTRNVVVAQHGPFFYLQFADEDFKPYPCGHEGLRCDLLDSMVAWLVEVEHVLADDDLLEAGDVARFGSNRESLIEDQWIGMPVSAFLRAALSLGWRVVTCKKF